MIPTLLLDLLLSLAVPAFRLAILGIPAHLVTLPSLWVLTTLAFPLPLPFSLAPAYSPNAIPASAVLILAVLPFALAFTSALTLLGLASTLFGLTLLNFSLALLLSLTLLLLPGIVALLYLLAPLGSPSTSFLSLLLRTRRGLCGRRAALSGLLCLTLLPAFGPLLLTLLLALGSLLLPLLATLVSTPLRLCIGAKPDQRKTGNAESESKPLNHSVYHRFLLLT